MNQEPGSSSGSAGRPLDERRPNRPQWRPPNARGHGGRGRLRRPHNNPIAATPIQSDLHPIGEQRCDNVTEEITNTRINMSNDRVVADAYGQRANMDAPCSSTHVNRSGFGSDHHPIVRDQSNQGRSNNNNIRQQSRRGGGRGRRQQHKNIGDAIADENEYQAPNGERRYDNRRRGRAQPRSRGQTSNLRYFDGLNNDPDHQNKPEECKHGDNQNQQQQRRPTKQSAIDTVSSHHHDKCSSKSVSNVQSEISEHQLRSNNFECMICCDTIYRTNPIWYCSNCYNIFHLKCAIEWCNKSIKSRDDAIASAQYPSLSSQINRSTGLEQVGPATHQGYSDYQTERLNSVEWACPTCREVLYSKPNKYKCFCGKVVRPEISRHLTPHSCGQLCGRKRPNFDCPHTCNSICHPGRCAPCPLASRRSCFCGKLISEIKCSVDTSSCDHTCGKPMSCGVHFCTKICHSGTCGSCEETLTISCHCGQQEVIKRCIELSNGGGKRQNFSCDKICGKPLDCGEHYCTQKCHPGPDCASCKLLSRNIKTCPCGSTLIKKNLLLERKKCTDPVPTCENKCNRPLICGPEKNRHKCQKKCHTGPCPPCKLKTTAYCECKLSTKTIECLLMYDRVINGEQVYFRQVKYSFHCETRCNKLKNCGRHRCYNKCCNKTSEAMIHKCDQICNRKLPCGLHNCPEICHPGQCGDCTNIGWQELTCHCGSSVLYPPIPCGARPPACHRPCRRAHSCGHPVKHECHDDAEKCAPCIVFVKKSCFCGSDSKDSVYCYLLGYSCGRTCKKQLSCRQHQCKRVCHDNECETPNERGVILCIQPCPVTRYSCKHPCGLPCHTTTPCPPSECKKTVEITCECGNKAERLECYKVMKDVDNRNKVAMLSTNRFNQDSIIIDLSKKPVPTKSENKGLAKRLDCDESCSILKRNKALAEALDIAQPDLKPISIFGEDPLRLLKEATAQDYKFVAATFNTLSRFIKSAKESDKRFIFMQFPPAGKLRREVVHELAHHFNCTSESREEEPFRHVVVRAYKNKSCVPDFSIEQLLPCESI